MTGQENRDRITIVLMDPQDGANIGSVCRAMKTMGLSRLCIVTSREHDDSRIRSLSVHAYDVYENRTQFTTLEEALEGFSLSVAATRRHGRFRKFSAASPEELAGQLTTFGQGHVAIVFGRESDGLTDEEVNLCNRVVTIPTSPAFPSLNLSQAVQIICYALFTGISEWGVQTMAVPAFRCQKAADDCIQSLDSISYFKNQDEKDMTRGLLVDVFARAGLCENEISRMEKIFRKASVMKIHKGDEN